MIRMRSAEFLIKLKDINRNLAEILQLQELHQKKKPTYYGGL